MGLDSYIFKIRKVNNPEQYNGKNRQSWPDNIIGVSLKNGVQPEFKAIAHLLSKISTKEKVWDLDKIYNDYFDGCDKNSLQIVMITGRAHHFSAKKNGETVNAVLENTQEEYIKERIVATGIFEESEVAYWRKDYDIQKVIYRNDERTDNTTYVPLTRKMYDEIVKLCGKQFEFEEDLYYFEWY